MNEAILVRNQDSIPKNIDHGTRFPVSFTNIKPTPIEPKITRRKTSEKVITSFLQDSGRTKSVLSPDQFARLRHDAD